MNAGEYRDPFKIEKNSYTSDEIGNQTALWTEYYKGYAFVNNLYGAEYWEAAQTQAENTVVFTMRYHPLLDTINTRGFRLIYRGKIYNIKSIDNVKYRNELVKIKATMKG